MIKTKLQFERTTPGTHLFKNDTPGAPIRNIYLPKSVFGANRPPTEITLTVDGEGIVDSNT